MFKLTIDDAVLNHLPVHCMPLYIFYDDLFHDHARERGEADGSVVSRILLSTFLKDGYNVSPSPVTLNFTRLSCF